MASSQPKATEQTTTSRKDRICYNFKTDPNLIQLKSLSQRAIFAFPSATSRYLLEKLPIIKWLPTYSTQWILSDIVAGTTIGLLLVPQSLAYARIANIPEQYGLMSSWMPPLVHALMGTSKDVCPGPTSIVGVLVAEIYNDFRYEGIPAQIISGVLTFLVGIIGLSIGLLKLGFVLDFISAPVLSGFVCAAGFLTIISQIPPLFGTTAGSGTIRKIHDAFEKLPQAKPWDTLLGLSCILILILMQQAGNRWGKKNKFIWAISTCRNAILIAAFTTVSYLVNKNVKTPYFAISEISSTKIKAPSVPSSSLLRRLSSRCITIFLATALEHLAIAKTFSRRNGYKIDASQELVFIGVSNLLNGFFPTMPGGGSLSRSAVNSDSGVKTPLSGVITSAFVLLSLYFLTGALYWIPKATLAAIIITAVSSLLVSPAVFYSYWRISLQDFIASMISFWVALLVSIEMGIILAVSFNILLVLLRMTFSQMKRVSLNDWPSLYSNSLSSSLPSSLSIPGESLEKSTLIFAPKQPIIFLNAERTKSSILDSYYNYISSESSRYAMPESFEIPKPETSWTDNNNIRIESREISSARTSKICLQQSSFALVLDLSHVFYIDVTGIQALSDVRSEIHTHTDSQVEWRLVGLRPCLRTRLERAGWKFQDIGYEEWGVSLFEETGENVPILVFENVHQAIIFGRGKIFGTL